MKTIRINGAANYFNGLWLYLGKMFPQFVVKKVAAHGGKKLVFIDLTYDERKEVFDAAIDFYDSKNKIIFFYEAHANICHAECFGDFNGTVQQHRHFYNQLHIGGQFPSSCFFCPSFNSCPGVFKI